MTKPPPTMDIDLREIESLLKRTKSVLAPRRLVPMNCEFQICP